MFGIFISKRTKNIFQDSIIIFYENNLTSKFHSLEMELGEAPSADLVQSYEYMKAELHQLHLDRAKGSVLRSKAQLVDN